MGRLTGPLLEATKIAFVATEINIAPLAHREGVDWTELHDFMSETISRDRVDFSFIFRGSAYVVNVTVESDGNSMWDIQEGDFAAIAEEGVPDLCVAIAEALLLDD